jgi:hypothetical protein
MAPDTQLHMPNVVCIICELVLSQIIPPTLKGFMGRLDIPMSAACTPAHPASAYCSDDRMLWKVSKTQNMTHYYFRYTVPKTL